MEDDARYEQRSMTVLLHSRSPFSQDGARARARHMEHFTALAQVEGLDLEAAWPMIRAIIRTRLRHGYHIL